MTLRTMVLEELTTLLAHLLLLLMQLLLIIITSDSGSVAVHYYLFILHGYTPASVSGQQMSASELHRWWGKQRLSSSSETPS